MANYGGIVDRKQTYEGIYIGEQVFDLHGFEDSETFSDESVCDFFHVTKALLVFEVGVKTFYSECSEEFLIMLNDLKQEYSCSIIDQIKGE